MTRLAPLCFAMGFGLLSWGCENPADNTTMAEVSDAAPSGENTPATDTVDETTGTTYALTPENTKVDFVGSKVTGSHEGGFKTVTGNWIVEGEDPATSRIDVEIDMNSTWSDSDKLTAHLKNEDFFEVETYPTSTFKSSEIAAEEGAYRVTGELTLHGVSKQIAFPAEIAITESKATLTSEFAINRKDFGIEYSGQSDNLIRDEVVIKIAIDATPGPAEPSDAGDTENGTAEEA